MHRSPTEITAGVSGMTNASKLPPLNLGHAMRTEPRALEEPPAVFRVIDCLSLRINPIAPAKRMYLSAMRLCPHPVSTMKLNGPRCTESESRHPTAAEPCELPLLRPSALSQRCQTSSSRSDALTKASADEALHWMENRWRCSAGNFHLSCELEGNSTGSWRRAFLRVVAGSAVEGANRTRKLRQPFLEDLTQLLFGGSPQYSLMASRERGAQKIARIVSNSSTCSLRSCSDAGTASLEKRDSIPMQSLLEACGKYEPACFSSELPQSSGAGHAMAPRLAGPAG